MDIRSDRDDAFEAALTAGAFLATILTGVFAFLDGLGGSRWFAYEFALAFACGVSFVTLLTAHDGF